GMVPHWADIKLARQTYNARTETVASKPSFRNAYKRGQFCVLPVSSFYEPSYESGKAARWEIANAALRTGRFEQLVFLYFIGVAARLIRIEMDDGNWPPVARVAAPAFRMCGPCCLVHLVTIAQQPSSRPATD
ncbi:MAG: response-associated peptidase, partial [Burkholderia sp.]|nr:response-associated peptidase [Burkholderia sp.]